MTVFIDRPLWPARGRTPAGPAPDHRDGAPAPRLWSHLVSDVSFDELHAFAARLGVPPRAFDRDHYDVPEELYEAAVAMGARPVGARELVGRLTAAGLRRRKRPAGR